MLFHGKMWKILKSRKMTSSGRILMANRYDFSITWFYTCYQKKGDVVIGSDSCCLHFSVRHGPAAQDADLYLGRSGR